MILTKSLLRLSNTYKNFIISIKKKKKNLPTRQQFFSLSFIFDSFSTTPTFLGKNINTNGSFPLYQNYLLSDWYKNFVFSVSPYFEIRFSFAFFFSHFFCLAWFFIFWPTLSRIFNGLLLLC